MITLLDSLYQPQGSPEMKTKARYRKIPTKLLDFICTLLERSEKKSMKLVLLRSSKRLSQSNYQLFN